mgnify:CR=1 FL=1
MPWLTAVFIPYQTAERVLQDSADGAAAILHAALYALTNDNKEISATTINSALRRRRGELKRNPADRRAHFVGAERKIPENIKKRSRTSETL